MGPAASGRGVGNGAPFHFLGLIRVYPLLSARIRGKNAPPHPRRGDCAAGRGLAILTAMKTARLVFLLLCLSLAAACGTKGDLVLPPKDAPAETK